MLHLRNYFKILHENKPLTIWLYNYDKKEMKTTFKRPRKQVQLFNQLYLSLDHKTK